jgi:ParB family chromosome partitioning protein
LLRLLNLTAAVQEMLMHSQIDMGHARALLSLDGAKQIQAAQHVAQKKLSVREAERMVHQYLHPKITPRAKPNRDLLRLEEIAADRVGAKVSIKHGAKGAGKLVIEYKNLDQLDGILGLMGVDVG